MNNEYASDFEIILRSLGMIFLVVGILAVIPLLLTSYYNEDLLPFLIVSIVPLLIGIGLAKVYTGEFEMHTKHATITAALTYLLMALLGAIPFIYYGMGTLDSLFEAMSGWTTTGLTMISDVEAMPKSVLFWRSFMQWIGGIGVIVLMLVVLSGVGSSMSKFYAAEARKDRIKPRLISTVRLIWWIYLIYTFLGILLYYIAGMSLFDAVNHSMSMLSTGGFSTNNINIQGFESVRIEEVTMILMLLGATNFLIHYRFLSGYRKAFIEDFETKTLYLLVALGSIMLFLKIHAFRPSLFQTVSSLTTTGASSIIVSGLDDFSKLSMSFMMMVGSSAGSTGGGFKIIRFLIVIKMIQWWIQQKLLPEHAVVANKIKGVELSDKELQEPAVLLLLYLFIFSAGTLIFLFLGYPTIDAIFEVASAQSNVGLSTGITGVDLPLAGKAVLIFNMWIGRLEIIPVLVLLEALASKMPRFKKEEKQL